LLSTTIVTLPWLLKRTRLLPNACLFPKSRVAKHPYEVIVLSSYMYVSHAKYTIQSVMLLPDCSLHSANAWAPCCHASTLGTTQTHGTVLLVASGMSANRSKDILLVWLCREWNHSSSSAHCVNVTEMVNPNMLKRQLHSLHQCNL
jgi:hypothetical protein